MAKLPLSEEQFIEQFGPHLNATPVLGWRGDVEPDTLVKTHCCFCSMQCGIQLKVKENRVIGFEPWEEFPFNQGRLCPKGVKRYMQDNHPDRLLYPLIRTDSGFRRATWDEAMELIVQRIRQIQTEHGPDAFGMLSGVSLSNEKSYLIGKFARLALRTKNLDYNGRLCMVSAGAGNKKAFGIDRAANPWEDIAHTKCLILIGTNTAECAPITVEYIWRMKEAGGKLIVIDPRYTPIARNADLYIPLKPGSDSALMDGILHVCVERGYLDEAFIEGHTNGWAELRETVRKYTPEYVGAICGVKPELIEQAAELWGKAEGGLSMLLHARGLEHQSKGVENVLSCINLILATGRIGRRGAGYGTITGQGNGQGGREHGHKCDQLPGNRDIENPEHRAFIASVWGVPEAEIPHKGLSAEEMVEAMERSEVRGLISICFNPVVSLPDATFTKRAIEKLDFFVAIDFFMSETAQYADVILPGSLHEEEEGTATNVEGRVIHLRAAVTPPGEARTDTAIILELARRLGRGEYFNYTGSEQIFNELRVASHGGTADYGGITYERIDKEMGVCWPCPTEDHPGTPRLFADLKFSHPDGRAKFHAIEYRPPAEVPDLEYPLFLTTGRVISQYLSGTQTRRIAALVNQYPEPKVEMHPRLAERLGVKDGDLVRVTSRRGQLALKAMVVRTIRPDTVFIPYHWPGRLSANLLTNRALDPVSRIPEFKISAVRVERVSQ